MRAWGEGRRARARTGARFPGREIIGRVGEHEVERAAQRRRASAARRAAISASAPELSRLRRRRRPREERCRRSRGGAPRDSASIPRAPEPANRSSTRRPSMAPRMENSASRTRSAVGRVSVPGGAGAAAPWAPATIHSSAPDASGRLGQRLQDRAVALGLLDQRSSRLPARRARRPSQPVAPNAGGASWYAQRAGQVQVALRHRMRRCPRRRHSRSEPAAGDLAQQRAPEPLPRRRNAWARVVHARRWPDLAAHRRRSPAAVHVEQPELLRRLGDIER